MWSLREGPSSSVRRKQVTALKAAFALATKGKSRLLAENPLSDVPLPPAVARERHYLDWPQLDALAEACGTYAGLIYVLGTSGPRIEEAARLDVKDLNRNKNTLFIRKSKTDAGKNRTTPIDPEYVAMLRTGIGPLFLSPDQQHRINTNNFRQRVFDPAVDKLFDFPLTPHDLRHTCASLAIAAGVDVLQVANMLGHADPSVTLRVYGHLFKARGLDSVLAKMRQAHEQALVLVGNR
ncbi:Site-specific recombinase XerD [Microlunatus flavus]|uniref:Site-specific recombinase XerD n=1 Tax=Microlunatus flavus TaxID=1036181 RepID=A0A1H9LLM8_9ACTN|nr:Site-specific recombinase XerD [Microlunatus flavus]